MSLQLLMQTDGTVTELIKLLSREDIKVSKISEKMDEINQQKILNRCIFLQGRKSNKNWLYAQSKIYLDNLSNSFVKDLLEKNIPIGTLWVNHRIETFKLLIDQYEETLGDTMSKEFKQGTIVLTRIYHVFNQNKIIMEITEKFPIKPYVELF
ncbi:MAG: chorismate pyruvate-lyase family protein [Proteobacteria bacterium]|nr:chorismate pyruvate-lyase family protein [Pseudomonadota bacterium]